MSNNLEKLVNDNRDEFDDKNVPAGLWDKIEQQIQPKKFTRRSFSDGGKSTPVIKMGWMKMAAAAAVIAAIGLITFKIINNKTAGEEVVTAKSVNPVKTNDTVITHEPLIAKQTPTGNKETEQPQPITLAKNENTKEAANTDANNSDDELVHFAAIIKIKQKQLTTIKHDSPELYEHFVTDYQKLDASYNDLKEEMKTNPNKEVLLEKMIGNLQLQIELLNQQLKVVRQLNKLKKDKADEISKTM